MSPLETSKPADLPAEEIIKMILKGTFFTKYIQ